MRRVVRSLVLKSAPIADYFDRVLGAGTVEGDQRCWPVCDPYWVRLLEREGHCFVRVVPEVYGIHYVEVRSESDAERLVLWIRECAAETAGAPATRPA